jgi:hypothetical protein
MMFIPLTVIVSVMTVLKEPFLGWQQGLFVIFVEWGLCAAVMPPV